MADVSALKIFIGLAPVIPSQNIVLMSDLMASDDCFAATCAFRHSRAKYVTRPLSDSGASAVTTISQFAIPLQLHAHLSSLCQKPDTVMSLIQMPLLIKMLPIATLISSTELTTA